MEEANGARKQEKKSVWKVSLPSPIHMHVVCATPFRMRKQEKIVNAEEAQPAHWLAFH